MFDPDKEDAQKERPIKRLLILGRAGIGKSTFCHYAAHQWAKGNLWKDKFKLLLWVPLRKILTYLSDECTLEHVILKECIKENERGKKLYDIQDLDQIIEHLPFDQVLFVLDGYDEISHYACELENKQTFQGKLIRLLLSQENVIITSRPYRIEEYLSSSWNKKPIDRTLESIGFLDKDIDLFVNVFFEGVEEKQKYSNSLKTFLNQNGNIKGIAHIPINLILLCNAWKNHYENIDLNKIKEIKVTTLYLGLITDLSIRYLQEKCDTKIDSTKTRFDSILNHPECTPIINFLSQLAFEQMQEESLIIEQNKIISLKWQGKEILNKVLEFGLLKSLGTGKKEDQKSYYFVHLSFQEFLAAYYITEKLKLDDKDIKLFISTHKYQPEYEITWWFVAGLLKKESIILEKFFDILEATPTDIVGLYHKCLMIRCIDEVMPKMNWKRKEIFLRDLRIWLNYLMKPTCLLIQLSNTILHYLELSPNVFNEPTVVEHFVNLLKDDEKKFYTAAILHKHFNLPEEILEQLVYLLKIKNDNISFKHLIEVSISKNNFRMMMVTTLRKHSNLSFKVLEELVTLLKAEDNDGDLKLLIATLLSKQYTLPEEIFKQIVHIFNNADKQDRGYCYCLLKILRHRYRLGDVLTFSYEPSYDFTLVEVVPGEVDLSTQFFINFLNNQDEALQNLASKCLIEKIPVYCSEEKMLFFIGKLGKLKFTTSDEKNQFIENFQRNIFLLISFFKIDVLGKSLKNISVDRKTLDAFFGSYSDSSYMAKSEFDELSKERLQNSSNTSEKLVSDSTGSSTFVLNPPLSLGNSTSLSTLSIFAQKDKQYCKEIKDEEIENEEFLPCTII